MRYYDTEEEAQAAVDRITVSKFCPKTRAVCVGNCIAYKPARVVRDEENFIGVESDYCRIFSLYLDSK